MSPSCAALVLVPAAMSVGLHLRSTRRCTGPAVVGVALVASLIALAGLVYPPGATLAGDALSIDATARLFLSVVNPIFMGIAVFVGTTPSPREGSGRFGVLGLAFLAAVNTVLMANHLLLQWIALEATTLAVAPLIVRPGKPASRRASWHYLLFSTVALSLVMLGAMCVALALVGAGLEPSFFFDRLSQQVPAAPGPLASLGVALMLTGVGAKLGLAPMYAWLPAAYDQAPPAVTALLGAVQFNASLVMLVRIVQVFGPSHPGLVGGLLTTLGLASMAISTVGIIGTRNLKRLLAFASINHAGVIAIGMGLGRQASYGVLLYALSNACIKGILFLTAGRIKTYYGTRDTRQISGLIIDMPYSGVFLMVGTFALLGFPPFGSFIGELLILSALVGTGRILIFCAFCVLITMTFVATGRTIFPMIWGEPRSRHDWPKQTFGTVWIKIALLVSLVVLGTCIPPPVERLIHEVSSSLTPR